MSETLNHIASVSHVGATLCYFPVVVVVMVLVMVIVSHSQILIIQQFCSKVP